MHVYVSSGSVCVLLWVSRKEDMHECLNMDKVSVHGNVHWCGYGWQRQVIHYEALKSHLFIISVHALTFCGPLSLSLSFNTHFMDLASFLPVPLLIRCLNFRGFFCILAPRCILWNLGRYFYGALLKIYILYLYLLNVSLLSCVHILLLLFLKNNNW